MIIIVHTKMMRYTIHSYRYNKNIATTTTTANLQSFLFGECMEGPLSKIELLLEGPPVRLLPPSSAQRNLVLTHKGLV